MFKFAIALLFQVTLCSAAMAQITLDRISAGTCTAPCSAVAVIFVHGLTGSAATWAKSEQHKSFPTLLVEDQALKDKIDVYTLQYASFWTSGAPIVEVTKKVAEKIDPLIKEKKYSKVVFVAHSLGGNIVSKYLTHVKLRYGHAALSRFRSLIALGTPFEGASLAGLANLFSGNDQIRSLLDIRSNDFLQLLKDTREDYLGKNLDHHCASLEFDAGFETLPVVFGTALIVSEQSAKAGASRSQRFAKHHLSLPKPEDENDEVFVWVKKELGLCVAGVERCIAAVSPDQTCTSGDF